MLSGWLGLRRLVGGLGLIGRAYRAEFFYSPIPQPLTPRRGKGSLRRTAHLVASRGIGKQVREVAIGFCW